MSLQMKSKCERCERALEVSARAFICSYECTFCPTCAGELKGVCPACSGELVPRPVRDAKQSASGVHSTTTPFNAYFDS
jgi:hypothetical protein